MIMLTQYLHCTLQLAAYSSCSNLTYTLKAKTRFFGIVKKIEKKVYLHKNVPYRKYDRKFVKMINTQHNPNENLRSRTFLADYNVKDSLNLS